jgi:GNAT superfamily N-acetyltransferase/nitroimidazol reductase NimA-like FMN-containing flavoprotein (pyridoxamine 5'-phosphate oxidase superfamily)
MSNLEPVQFKKVYRASEAEAYRLFASAPSMRIASVDEHGMPLLRTVHAVVVDGRIAFHAGDHGGKLALLDRPVVLSVEDIVTEIPSTFIDPVMACPATTYFLSATAHGTLRRVEDRERKARVLRALMERFQAEGGYAPITLSCPQYAREIDALLVAELVPERLTAKHKLGQNRSAEVMKGVLTKLFERGLVQDLRAIRLVREAHPERPVPEFLRGPGESVLCVAPDAEDAERVARMLKGLYWTLDLSHECLREAQLGSAAWVVARAREGGEVVASARAVSDGARFAYVLDVIVREDLRGQGYGRALMRLLLSHPRVRGAQRIGLRTRDAAAVYTPFGFVPRLDTAGEMLMTRAVPSEAGQ